ncbi:Acyl transferase/acyl hydrolase/lysophospholipase [Ascosphaera apis ARSEF 7405]|uniref:Lysophospholipase n=1 Tax=Ascosphaera apis ARSEF 7405 TaxID=392613 RepID=A0A167ZAA3_9EURO|nr:Acyl transferase/acyl hydrolase/lysophospholipase [Ascosphaera apis ARSEF 7405]
MFSQWSGGKEEDLKGEQPNQPDQAKGTNSQSPSSSQTQSVSSSDPPPLSQRVQETFSANFQRLPSLQGLSGLSGKLPAAPDFSNTLIDKVLTIRRHLSDVPDSLASEIWTDARDPSKNPEILREAAVRIASELCPEEKEFLDKRREHVRKSFAKFIGVPESEVEAEDVPSIGVATSGGSLRALCANSGTLAAAQEDGLWDCITYTTGLSSGCWLLALYFSSFIGQDFHKLIDHLRERLPLPTIWPPDGIDALVDEKTGKFLLAGLVEKMRETPHFDLGVVDLFGLFTGYKLFLPSDPNKLQLTDLKLSAQAKYLSEGQQPLPIYTAGRHENPPERADPRFSGASISDEEVKALEAKENEATFQIWEFSPYELYSEELGAGIPTWATGRHFNKGKQITTDKVKGEENDKKKVNMENEGKGIGAPELKTPYLLGLWGSAFCATMARWYSEFRPLLSDLPGPGPRALERFDKIMAGYSNQLGRMQPVDSAIIPNYFTGLTPEQLAPTTPRSIFDTDNGDPGLRFTDAGMSGRMPIYPLLRKGREVDVIIALDASADIGGKGWGDDGIISEVDGYTLQRGIKAEAVKRGWPFKDTSTDEIADILENARVRGGEAATGWRKAENKRTKTKDLKATGEGKEGEQQKDKEDVLSDDTAERPEGSGFDYCNVYIGQASWRHTDGDKPPPWKFEFDMPDVHSYESAQKASDSSDPSSPPMFEPSTETPAKTVIYMPLLPNKDAPPLKIPPQPASWLSGSILGSWTSSGEESKQPETRSIDPTKEDFMSTWNFEYTPDQVDAVANLARTNYEVSREKIKRVLKGAWEAKKRTRKALNK